MDKLAEQLKSDAKAIEVEVSDELNRRIRASLRGTEPERDERVRPQQRPAAFWWASSLTGIAAALVVIAVINSHSQVAERPQTTAAITPEIVSAPVPVLSRTPPNSSSRNPH